MNKKLSHGIQYWHHAMAQQVTGYNRIASAAVDVHVTNSIGSSMAELWLPRLQRPGFNVGPQQATRCL